LIYSREKNGVDKEHQRNHAYPISTGWSDSEGFDCGREPSQQGKDAEIPTETGEIRHEHANTPERQPV